MKLKNKKTGEIIDIKDALRDSYDYPNHYLISSDWEDYEEPKVYWFINSLGEIICPYNPRLLPKGSKEIGNYFETKEEAEQAVEKLKAWKRLKDRHFKFDDYDILNQTATWLVSREYDQYEIDIKLLFGGEE